MLNNPSNLHSLASGDTYLDFIPMLKKTPSLIVDTFYSNSYRVDSLIKAEPGICQQQHVRFQGTPQFFTLQSQTWIVLLLLFQFFIYASVLVRSGKYLAESLKELLQVKERSSLFLDSSMKDPRRNFLLNVLAAINLSFFFYIFISSNSIYAENKSTTILLFFAILGLFLLLKYSLLNFLGFVFFGRNSTLESFKSSVSTMISFLGIVLFPIVLLLVYASVSLHSTLFVVGFFFCFLFVVFKAYRLLRFFYIEISSFFYLILYLCTIEILPAVLLFLTLVEIEQVV